MNIYIKKNMTTLKIRNFSRRINGEIDSEDEELIQKECEKTLVVRKMTPAERRKFKMKV